MAPIFPQFRRNRHSNPAGAAWKSGNGRPNAKKAQWEHPLGAAIRRLARV
jgi:hypothetical protein